MKFNWLKKSMSMMIVAAFAVSASSCNSSETPTETGGSSPTQASTEARATPAAAGEETPAETAGESAGAETAGTGEYVPYTPSEPVEIVYAGWGSALQNALMMDNFMKTHENIIVKPYEGSFPGEAELTQAAASGTMPDIVAINDLGLAMKNEWLVDIKPYFDADPIAAENTYQSIIDFCTVNGQLQVLATGIFNNAMNVNLSLLDSLNIEKPSYDWTIDEAVAIHKAATVKGQSLGGLNIEWMLTILPGAIGRPEMGNNFINMETRRFEMGEEFIRCVTLFKELFDAKTSLWEQVDLFGLPWEMEAGSAEQMESEENRNNYIMEALGTIEDGWAAGKTSMQDFPTYLLGWEESNPRGSEHGFAGFEYDTYPLPKGSKEGNIRFGVIADYAGVTASCKDPRAAYEYLRYITYDPQGYIDRMNTMNAYNKEEFMARYPQLTEDMFPEPELIISHQGAEFNALPGTSNAEALEMYKAFHKDGTSNGTPGLRHMADWVEGCAIDNHRTLPGFNEAWGYVRNAIFTEVVFGSKTASDIAAEVETTANTILDNWQATLDDIYS